MRKWVLLGIIIFIAAFLRLWQLGNIPYGFLNDEVVGIYNAESLWQTGGHVIDGSFLPLNIHGTGNDLTPVPVYIDSVFLGIFGMSPFVGRLPYALAGIGSIILLFFILEYMTRNNWISLGGAFVFAVSPWHIVISRGAWESIIAIFFYLLGIYIFLKTLKKGSILYSLPAFILGFYSYNASKIFFVVFITLLLFWYRKILLQRKKELTLFILGILLCIVSFIFVLKTSSISRSAVLIWQSPKFTKEVIKSVAFQRENSIAPNSVQLIFSNKAIEIFKDGIDNYLNFFSPFYLFLHGDTDMVNGFGIFSWGEMYLIELPLLFFGVYFILEKANKQNLMIFIIGLLAAPIATAVTVSNYQYEYFFRSNIAIPFLAAIVGFGIYVLWEYVRLRSALLKYSTIVVFILFYGFLISRFLYTYYFQFATFGAEFWLQSSRIVSMDVISSTLQGKHVYMGTTDREFILQYAFFSKTDPHLVQNIWRENSFILGNVTFGDTCEILRHKELPANSVFIVPASCNASIAFQTKVRDPYNSNVIWNIYEN